MNLIDRSNYFRASLLLIRKDHKISKPESELMIRIGKALGFEKRFCANAFHEALDNTHILNAPPKFSTKALAVKFIKDGLTLAMADNYIHPLEEQWLLSIAKRNGIGIRRYLREKEIFSGKKYHLSSLEVENMVVS
jgi:hypothetical protein